MHKIKIKGYTISILQLFILIFLNFSSFFNIIMAQSRRLLKSVNMIQTILSKYPDYPVRAPRNNLILYTNKRICGSNSQIQPFSQGPCRLLNNANHPTLRNQIQLLTIIRKTAISKHLRLKLSPKN